MIGKTCGVSPVKLEHIEDLSVGDILMYHSGGYSEGYAYYEILEIHPGRDQDLILKEVCRDKVFYLPERHNERSFGYDFEGATRTFKQIRKGPDRIIKQLLCRVVAAKLFMENELNEMLFELDI
jgi:hypothetical protein